MTANIITGIVQKRRNPSECAVFVDGELLCVCSIDLVALHRLSKGMKLDQEKIDALLADVRRYIVKQAALRYAVYKPRTCGQVRQSLTRKGFSTEEVSIAVAFLQEFDYLNDERYAGSFVRDNQHRKYYGKMRMAAELRKRFVPKEIVELSIREYFSNDDESNDAIRLAQKKLRQVQNKPIEKQKNAVVGALQRHGFPYSAIRIAVQELFSTDSSKKGGDYEWDKDQSSDRL